MKGYLLAGFAVIALTGTCGVAVADDTAPGKFDVKIGGDAYFEAGLLSENTDPKGTSTQEFANRFRLVVSPQATADNGLQYGARLRIRASSGTGVVDSDLTYIFVSGNFGSIEAGVDQNPNLRYNVIAPTAGTGGIDGDWSNGSGWLSNFGVFAEPYFSAAYWGVTETDRSTKIVYYTPRFLAQDAKDTGLLFGVSYAPSNISVDTNVNRWDKNPTLNAQQSNQWGGLSGILSGGDFRDVYEITARYDASFKDVSVSASAGYEGGSATEGVVGATDYNYKDLTAAQVGLQLGYAGFTIGGSYLNAGKSGYLDYSRTGNAIVKNHLSDQEAWTGGITYGFGAWTIGFNYLHGKDAGDITVAGDRTGDIYSVGANYTIAPGLTTAIDLDRFTSTNEAGFKFDPTGRPSGNANLVLWKTAVAF